LRFICEIEGFSKQKQNKACSFVIDTYPQFFVTQISRNLRLFICLLQLKRHIQVANDINNKVSMMNNVVK